MARRLLLLLVLLPGCTKKEAAPPEPVAKPVTVTGVRWDARLPDGTGTLYVQTSDGGERKVSDAAIDSWFSGDRKALYYSYRHGLSGYEREGMGIKRYLIADGESETVFDHDLMVMFLREAKSKSGKTVLLVDLIDGGRGAPEVVVADPDRGRVFVAEHSRVLASEGGTLTIGRYSDKQLDEMDFGSFPKPDREESFDLDELLSREASRDTPNPLPDE
jgi:hypothetical protein